VSDILFPTERGRGENHNKQIQKVTLKDDKKKSPEESKRSTFSKSGYMIAPSSREGFFARGAFSLDFLLRHP
jgi:hypothetical protein